MTAYRTKPSQVIVAAFGGHILGLDPSTGDVLWEHDVGGHTPRIIVTDTHVFALGSWFLCMSYPSGEVVWM
jgi:outer membrane protein assembly factor BamB